MGFHPFIISTNGMTRAFEDRGTWAWKGELGMERWSFPRRWTHRSASRRSGGMASLGVVVLSLVSALSFTETALGQEAPPPSVVHAILFYSPTCPHCHQVITEDLIPLQEQYGNRLVLLGLDTSQSWANDLFWEAIQHFEVPEDRWAVPFLVVGDQALIGGLEIPARFPSIIEAGLAGEGIDFPEITPIVSFLREQGVLDPRYPDRRVAVQVAPEDQPAEEADSSAQDAAEPVSADPSLSDTAQIEAAEGDSLPQEAAVDSAQDPAATEPVDSGPPAEAAFPPAEDTPIPTERPVRTDPEEETAAAEPPPDQPADRERAEPPDSASTPVATPVAPRPEAREPSPVGPAAMDLETAARELETMTMMDRFRLDPVGNSFSVAVLVVMVLVLLLRGYPPRAKGGLWPEWMFPALLVVGAAVAAYLSYVEVTGTQAVCGPVGDCNTVQQSPHARLFGILPVGVLGLMGYGAMFVLWIMVRTGSEKVGRRARLLLWAAALFGTLFSVYLTFLEPFVIGATCAWCLTSAAVMTLLLMASAPLAARVWPAPPHTSS